MGVDGCFELVFESSGVDEAAGGVVGQVAESQGDASQVLQAPVESPMFVKSGVRPGLWR